MKTIMIWGATGQDGSHLADLYIEEGNCRVIGVARRSSVDNTTRIKHILSSPIYILEEGDISDDFSVYKLIDKYKPDRIFNTAAMSHVGSSFGQPALTFAVNTGGVLNILESIKELKLQDKTRLIQCSTSEMFGDNYSILDNGTGEGIKCQHEGTDYSPQSPYAVSKVAAHQLINLYRKAYGIHASCTICFNHEGERRGDMFVTRKITKWIGENFDNINTGSTFNKLRLGNIYAYRDFGYARDYCEAMRLVIEQDKPDDYVVATGETHTVEEFLQEAFSYAFKEDYQNYVVIDESLKRPAEVPYLCGSPEKIKKLGWQPKVTFKELIHRMVDNDIKLYSNS